MPISSQVPAEIKQNSTQANKASCQANFKAKLQTDNNANYKPVSFILKPNLKIEIILNQKMKQSYG